MKIQHSVLYISFVILFVTTANAEEISKKVNISLGTELVKLAIAGTPYDHAGFGVPPENRRETFLVYQILGKYEGTVAWLAVNPWTGDVWNMDQCKLFSNSALRVAQEKIKKKFHKRELKEYERLHNIKPYHEYDLEACP